ncbi:MAG TPA: TonB-dependent receptor [Bryobacteraceae bacterium]|nr:TonB-dependent receptor [Bryobacteraceae bacterium]
MTFVCAKLVSLLLAGGFVAAQVSRIEVRVVDSQGAAVPQARVEARCGGGTTSELGVAELECAAPVEVSVSAAGFETARVTVTGASQTVQLAPAMVRNSVDVVVSDAPTVPVVSGDAVEIDRTGARTVFDAVEKLVPGAFVTHRGVLGYGISSNGTGQISIRGVGESPNAAVLIVVDGRPDFQGEMGHPLPDFFSLTDVGRVSVTEGPASVLYGSNAMGGVVEISPIRPSRENETRVMGSLGSFATGQYRLSNGGALGRFFYNVTGGISHTNGDRDFSHFREGDGSVLVGYDFSDHWKGTIDGRYGHFTVEDPGPLTNPASKNTAAVGRGGFSANLEDAYGRLYGSIRVYGSYGRNFITDGFRSIDDATGVRVDQTFAVSPTLLVEVGSDVMHYGGEAHQFRGVQYGTHHIDEQAGFLLAQWTPVRRLRFNAGYRYQANSQFGGISAPEAGASYGFSDKYSVAFQASRGFRNPTLRELYLFPAPNPTLMPETVWNYQAMFHARPLRTFHAWTTVYYARLDDMIVVLGRYPNLNLQNAGAAINRGLEVSSEWRPLGRVRVQGGYGYVRSTNLAPYVPAHKVNYSVEFPVRRLTVDFSGITVGQRYTSTAHTAHLDGYTDATLRLSYPLGERWTFFAMADNLFNQSYQFLPGYPMPGVNGSGGFMLRF